VTEYRDWPLIGRDREFAEAMSAMDRGTGVVFFGRQGVGKTRLAVETLEIASRRGFRSVRVAATHATSSLPFGAFAALLPALEQRIERSQVLQQITQEVVRRGEGGPVALLVDDAHVLDEGSAALTCQLSASADVFVVATVRSGEPVRDGLTRLWKDGLATRIDVQPLSEESFDELIAAGLGAPAEGVVVQQLHRRSAGNVLFLRELTLGAIASGALRLDDGLWHLVAGLPVSERLTDLVETNLQELSDGDRTALEFLALGEPLDLDLFDRLSGVGAHLGRLEARHLVVSKRSTRGVDVSLAHPVYGDVLRTGLSPRRVREIARALADEFSSDGPVTPEAALRIGVWWLQSGDPADRRILLEAARRAVILHDLDLAGHLASAAEMKSRGFETGLLLAQILSWNGQHEEAERRFAELAQQSLQDHDLAVLTISRIDNLLYNLGHWAEALEVADAAEARVSDPAGALEFTGYRASLLDVASNTARYVGLDAVLEHGEGRALAWACVMGGWSAARQGRLAEALALTKRGRQAHATITWPPLPWGVETHNIIKSWALGLAGCIAEAQAVARDVYTRGLQVGDMEAISTATTNLCLTYAAQGRLESAWRWGTESASIARHHGRAVVLKTALIALTESLAIGDRAGEAKLILNELATLARMGLFDSEHLRVQAWVRVCGDDDLSGAMPLLWQAGGLAAEAGNWVWESAALHDLARLGQAAAVVDRLVELAELIEGPLIQARAAHAQALTQGDAHGLTSASRQFEDGGLIILAAESAADAAAAWLSVDQRRGVAAKQRAAALRAKCPRVRTPALVISATARARLTPRQLEIARLAATGTPNRQIAESLHLSVRTVENRLHDLYARLGITGREQLATAITEANEPD
jgi:DNA-binding CsgD family transcriptional regulator